MIRKQFLITVDFEQDFTLGAMLGAYTFLDTEGREVEGYTYGIKEVQA